MTSQTECRFHSKLDVFVRIAEQLSELSTCKRAMVAAIILPADFSQVYSIGYNGVPSSEPNDSCRDTVGSCGCVHAELNALLKLRWDDYDCRMLCVTEPCQFCAAAIINDGRVSRVVFTKAYRDSIGSDRLRAAGIETRDIQEVRDAGAAEWRAPRPRRQ